MSLEHISYSLNRQGCFLASLLKAAEPSGKRQSRAMAIRFYVTKEPSPCYISSFYLYCLFDTKAPNPSFNVSADKISRRVLTLIYVRKPLRLAGHLRPSFAETFFEVASYKSSKHGVLLPIDYMKVIFLIDAVYLYHR